MEDQIGETAPPRSPMHPERGPRVYVKRDSESGVHRGAVLYGAHFRPRIARMVQACCDAVRELDLGDEVWITEGWRFIRLTRDLHNTLDALDLTISKAGIKLSEGSYALVRDRMSEKLGPGYDLIAHGDGPSHHIHAEWDPKPGEKETAYV